MRKEIRIAGLGGQGVVLLGFIIAQAASIYDRKNATLIQDYGPEARGGACRAEVVISEEAVLYPYVVDPSILVLMSQEAYRKYGTKLGPGVKMLIDKDLVPLGAGTDSVYAIPATRFAQELGGTMVANVVMLGFFAATTEVVSVEALKKSLLASVPKGSEDLNIHAFERGYSHGRELLKGHRELI